MGAVDAEVSGHRGRCHPSRGYFGRGRRVAHGSAEDSEDPANFSTCIAVPAGSEGFGRDRTIENLAASLQAEKRNWKRTRGSEAEQKGPLGSGFMGAFCVPSLRFFPLV